MRRAQSVSTGNPSSKPDRVRFADRRSPGEESYSSLSAAYLEQSRTVLDRQRENFENERAVFAEERQLWEKERALLKLRISELESMLKGQGTRLTTAPGSKPRHAHFDIPWPRIASDGSNHSSQVWHSPSPASQPTRVFPEKGKRETLPQITEQAASGTSSLDAALSPQSRAIDPTGNMSVPIEKVDSRLDGITLKSSALPPDVIARVMTPPSPSPLEIPPAAAPHRPSVDRRNSLRLKIADLGAPQENLTRDAGHTPMAIIEGEPEVGRLTEGKVEAPEEPRPREESESYFPDEEGDPDPALKGPLFLLNDEVHDQGFLKELDQKLLHQANQILSKPTESKDEEGSEGPNQSQPEPELKFKNTTNFGTAFGESNLGGA